MPCNEDQDVPHRVVPAEVELLVVAAPRLFHTVPLFEELSLIPRETGREGRTLDVGEPALDERAVQLAGSYEDIFGSGVT